MKNFHQRGDWTIHKFESFIRSVKLVVFDVALLILFILALIKIIRAELGW
ncbi:MAG: hypothetical protein ABSE86_34440 [Bryobacteraceae bacterium]|jgi:hypothetical protein